MSNWYVDAFKADYLTCYPHRSDAAAKREAAFLRKALNAKRGALILDLCCGAGRHSRALSAAGFKVVGIDLSADLLFMGRRRPAPATSPFYLRGDMRRLPLKSESVDHVVNLFTSFGYFSTDRQNEQSLLEAVRVLRPGGRLVLDFFNVTYVRKNLIAESERDVDGECITERRWYDAKRRRLLKTTTGCACGKPVDRMESVRAYSPAELATLFKRAGLRLIARYGDLHGAKFNSKSSPRCVLIGEKA